MAEYKRITFWLCLIFLILVTYQKPVNAITFGVGYANPAWEKYDWTKLAKLFSSLGISSVKIQQLRWGDIEPAPPKLGQAHKYKWDKIDRIITIFQAEGFTDMEIVLESFSKWAGRSPTKNDTQDANTFQLRNLALPPKENHWKDYADFISNVIERYDGDGNNDMPNLKYPILNYEIETEAQGSYHWLGTVDEYIRQLKVAYMAAIKANSHVNIILTGFWLGDVVHPNEPYEKRIEMMNPKLFNKKNWYKYIRTNQKLLKEKDYFDKVEFHSLENYSAIYTAVEWIRQEMKRNGYEKPIYIGDACATPTLTFGPVKPHPHPFKMEAQEVVKILADRKNVMYKEVNSWYRAEESRLIVKKTVAALEMGLEKINFGFMMDNTSVDKVGVSLLASLNPLAYNWLIAGLLDNNYQPYPAYFTYKLTVEKLKNAVFVKQLSLGTDLYGFEFLSAGAPIYIFWSNKNVSITFTAGASFKTVKVTNIVVELGRQNPNVKEKTVKEGKVELNLTEDPIFVEPT